MPNEPLPCQAFCAPTLLNWIKHRGGIAVWLSKDLSDPGWSVSTPALTLEKTDYPRPHWKAGERPDRIITSTDEVLVSESKEVRRFRVAIRRGAQGFSFKVTEAGSRKIRSALEKAGDGAYHTFDYDTQEAVIWVPRKAMSLTQWEKENPGG